MLFQNLCIDYYMIFSKLQKFVKYSEMKYWLSQKKARLQLIMSLWITVSYRS